MSRPAMAVVRCSPLGAIGSIGAAQHGDLVAKPKGDVSLPAVRAQEHVNKRRHPFRCLLHSFQ